MKSDTNPTGFWTELIASFLAGAMQATFVVLVLAGLHYLLGAATHDWADLWWWISVAFAMGAFDNKKKRARIAFAKKCEERQP